MVNWIRLRDTAVVHTADGGETLLLGPSHRASLGTLTPVQQAVLKQLADGDCDSEALLADAVAQGAARGLREAYGLLARLRLGDWLCVTLAYDGRPLLTICPSGTPAGSDDRCASDIVADALSGVAGDVSETLVLSRFAVLRRHADGPLLESPLSRFGVHLHEPALLEVLGELARPRPTTDLPVPAALGPDAVAAAVRALVAGGFVVAAGSAEDTDPAMLQWSPHELWFHARSRQGRHDAPWGATYWARGRFDPLPARRAPAATTPALALPVPDLFAATAHEPGLTEIMEARRSLRRHDDAAPLRLAQLGEFLYRTARTRRTWALDGVELADRPYPSGGALHELEVYPVVGLVAGLASGLYRYDGQAHQLEQVAGGIPPVRQLLSRAAGSAAMTAPPQVLFVITARFGRVMWKYESMAYALILKNVGALMAAMYNVATAMGLAPCALGGGDADLFGRAAGLDYLTESSVGEFVLGSAAPTVTTGAHQGRE